MIRYVLLTTLLLSVACGNKDAVNEPPRCLRVGTHGGLLPLTSTVRESHTTQFAELVYQRPLGAYFAEARPRGKTVELRIRPEQRDRLEEIARTFAHPDAKRVEVVGDLLVVELSSEDAAGKVTLHEQLTGDGAFRVIETVPGRLLLERRQPSPRVPCIEITDHASADITWRRLMAGELDVLPFVEALAAAQVRDVPSLRLVRLTEPASTGLWFSISRRPLDDRRVRQAVSLAIRRRAIAATVAGDATLAADVREDIAEARRVLAELRAAGSPVAELTLLVADTEPQFQRAALVIQQQLAAIDIHLVIRVLPVAEMSRLMLTGEFDLALHFAGWERRAWFYFRADSPGNFLGYRSAAFEAAVAADDEAAARDVLASDVPVTPLYWQPDAAVVNREYCDVHPVRSNEVLWLADVRRCAPGEAD